MSRTGRDGRLVLRPYRLRFVAGFFGLLLVGIYVGGWFALPRELREQVTLSQIVTLLLFLAFFVGVLVAVAGSVVVADADGLRIRNGVRRHVVGWGRVERFVLRPGDPWAAVLLRPDEERLEDGPDEPGEPGEPVEPVRQPLLGVQAHDGDRARRAVAALRAEHAAWSVATRSRGT